MPIAKAKSPRKVTAKVTASAKTKAWTFMVYLAGDNDLDGAGVTDLAEMKRVGSGDAVNIVAQFDREGPGLETNRYFLRKGTALKKDVVQSLGETNTGDPKVLGDFIRWAAKNYPAERYMLVLWNHGAGWDDTNIYRAARGAKLGVTRKGEAVAVTRGSRTPAASGAKVPMGQLRAISNKRFRRALFRSTIETAIKSRAIAFDDNAQDFLDSVEMKRVLLATKKSLGHKFAVLGMDACLMSMAEVAHQVRASVEYSVGSEEVEPADGWPYDKILARLAANPAMASSELTKIVVQEYVKSYPASEAVTQSALDLSKVAALTKSLDALAVRLTGLPPAQWATLAAVRAQVQSYDTADYVDLIDLCGLLQARLLTVAAQAAEVIADAKAAIVASASKGASMRNSNGVSVYFPTKTLSPLYARLDFAKSARWDEFLKTYLAQMTRRPN